jgi:hypothetical protein
MSVVSVKDSDAFTRYFKLKKKKRYEIKYMVIQKEFTIVEVYYPVINYHMHI